MYIYIYIHNIHILSHNITQMLHMYGNIFLADFFWYLNEVKDSCNMKHLDYQLPCSKLYICVSGCILAGKTAWLMDTNPNN